MNDDWHACFHLQQSSMQPCHQVWSCDHQDRVSASAYQWDWSHPSEKQHDLHSYDTCTEINQSEQCGHMHCSLPETDESMSMQTVRIQSPAKRHCDDINICGLPLRRTCRQEGNVPAFHTDGEGFALSSLCNTFTIRNIDGVAKSLELDDLVDMVLQVTKNIEDSGLAQHVVYPSKRRQQNKAAAARYRDKQKERKESLQKEQADLERSNAKLKATVSDLEREVAEYKRKIMQLASDLNR